ncbi:methyl-accepting chemotaxis protein [Blastopirellula sp. JC732]|uniref:Methyl-accepting chemotaxis protein n=1 Tax=Blastopirellula sediminis TaxID=2894196 RepID=A0A9X1MN77_9BACT|nr:methyl-accepting chemotaxis protein [Blastopirellula sediminis]MCC9606439.1 methyl-accepting chemotaxis protein [Blastopirellula sediminis]MCC9630263.1 methyl-accepting chemotaxis protein [Blastopirellula sediminis]
MTNLEQNRPAGIRLNPLGRVSIRYQLGGAFAIVLLVMGVGMAIYHMAIRRTVDSYDSLLQGQISLQTLAEKTNVAMLECRRNEKDFLLRRDDKYIEKHAKSCQTLLDDAKSLEVLALSLHDQSAEADAQAIAAAAAEYQQSFVALTESWKRRGLDHNSGLQGQFRDVVHDLEELAKNYEVDALYLQVAALHRFAADGKGADNANRKSLIKAIEDVKQSLQSDRYAADLKKSQMALLTEVVAALEQDLAGKGGSGALEKATAKMEQDLRKQYVSGVSAKLLMIRRREKDYLLRADAKYVAQTHEAAKQFVAAFEASQVAPESVDQIRKSTGEYLRSFDALVQEDQNLAQLEQTLRAAVHKIEPLVDQIAYNAETTAAQFASQTAEQAETATFRATLAGGIAILLGLAIAWMLTRSITKPLSQMTALAAQVANGNLKETLNIRREDEIGQLAVAFNQLTTSLREIITSLSQEAEQLTGASSDMAATAGFLTEQAQNTRTRSASATAATEEISAQIDSMNHLTEEISSNFSVISTNMQEMSSCITEIAKNAERTSGSARTASQLTGDSRTTIDELGHAASEIGTFINTIQEIAEQTNLLALNATIEAARAGESGKGFAVVAGEVKELSKQTAAATEDISRRIAGIQKSSGAAIDSIARVASVISELDAMSQSIASAVEQQNVTTRHVVTSVGSATSSLETVASGISETNVAGEQIVSEIVAVSTAAETTVSHADAANATSVELSKIANKLRAAVARFEV